MLYKLKVRGSATAATAEDKNKGDDYYPDAVVVEKIAKTIHKYPPFAAHSGDILKK